ncbi:MAG: Asp-tRNA(Asn)/Glu-tRNA(Gln) amidotransferase subunit GatB [bacterium]|nr:Asp-tRNA(Asn)/Glu-tRNA(Gln) amidotransferase subunit GatB [bacterium]
MSKYSPTIGLEIHAELATKSKMFCDCKNDPNETRPNTNVCPICMGHPGTLPVPNQDAIKKILKVGLVLGGTLAKISKFDRKNYFYPDLPKGYQISQFDMPFVLGGELAGVKITRVHLEEDAGSLVHGAGGSSLVDFNRAGMPLMELVTEPVIYSAETAVEFARELQLILRYLGASEADMDRGQMRLEANISISKDKVLGLRQSNGLPGRTDLQSKSVLGTKVEVKNLNSFKILHDAIQYEIQRQGEALEAGEKIKQETRGWDENKKRTFSQRSKEEAHDYRYFPEPDIPPFDIQTLFDIDSLKAEIPELPSDKRKRFSEEYNLSPEKVDILIRDKTFANYFEEAASELSAFHKEPENQTGKPSEHLHITDYGLLYSYLINDLRGILSEQGLELKDLKFEHEDFAHLMFFVYTNKIGSRAAKDILKKMIETGADPENILREEGLEQISDEGELLKVVKEIINENSNIVESYKKGKDNAIQALVGKAMAKLKSSGNPQALLKLFKDELSI